MEFIIPETTRFNLFKIKMKIDGNWRDLRRDKGDQIWFVLCPFFDCKHSYSGLLLIGITLFNGEANASPIALALTIVRRTLGLFQR